MFKEGEVTIIEIQHDSWCKTLKTGSGLDCNCDPDVHSEDKEFMARFSKVVAAFPPKDE